MTLKRIVAFLLSVQVLLLGWIGWGTSPNATEMGHMGATVFFWHTLRFDVFCVNPPLTRMVTALPVALCNPKYDLGCYSSRPQDRCEWALGTAFMAANSAEKIRRCFALGRWSLIPLLFLGGYFGHRLSRELYGNAAGFVFLILWCFSPLLLAWGANMCPDAVAAALGLVAIYAFRQWLVKPNWEQSSIAGLCLGLLPLAKLTWIAAFGLWPVVWCLWTIPIYLTKADRRSLPLPRLRQLANILFLGIVMLNMGYSLDGTFLPLGKYEFISQSFGGRDISENQDAPVAANRFRGTWLGEIPVPLPADFVQGIDMQRLDFERGMPSYLRGEWANHGWWYYYLYVMLVKMPLGAWGLAVLAAIVTLGTLAKRTNRAPRGAVHLAERDDYVAQPPSPPAPLPAAEGSPSPLPPLPNRQRSYVAPWRDEMLILLPCAALFLLVSSQTGFSKHPRYILPALPFFFVTISRVGVAFTLKARVTQALAAIFLAYTLASSLSIYPHCMSYFNELAAIIPTSADGSYQERHSDPDEHRGLWETVKEALTSGSRNGPRHLLDSNIDWGQDLYYLEDWYVSHPESRPMKLTFFGGYPLEKSKIDSAGVPPIGLDREHINGYTDTTAFGPLPGWYALSVNEIYGELRQYRYFLNFQPVAMAGYSIYIYHITLDEANRVRRRNGLTELRTSGASLPFPSAPLPKVDGKHLPSPLRA